MTMRPEDIMPNSNNATLMNLFGAKSTDRQDEVVLPETEKCVIPTPSLREAALQIEYAKMEAIPAYPKIYALGHPALRNLLDGPVVVQEKIDGSQFSFAKLNGRLRVRSKGREIFVEAPDNMFREGVEYVQTIQDKLVEGWVYRAEYLRIPKHNSLCYSRIPRNHIVLYDVMTKRETFANPESLSTVADLLRIEPVQYFHNGPMDLALFQRFMGHESQLGGQTVEGVVIKNYGEFCQKTGHVLMGKYVSEAFKEVHGKEWKKNNPGRQEIMAMLIAKYRSNARWEKAVYHLRASCKVRPKTSVH